MGINTNFKAKSLSVNTSWKRFALDRDITIKREKTFTRETSFFTIGSCFANELRHALESRDFTVLPKLNPAIKPLFPDSVKKGVSWGDWDERVHLQFYNSFSIRQEFEKAFGIWQQADDDYIAVTHAGETQYWDPYRRSTHTDSVEKFIEVKRLLDDSLASAIHSADVSVITLGMTEAFFRRDNGRATCQYNRHFHGLAEFRATSYEENYANLEKICELFFEAYPDRHIVVTVSPVALAQTFTDSDVVVANMESKSILRAVAGAIARKWPNVNYWPSYEIVMWNERSWQPDIRHVQPERVASIMDAFAECHIEGVDTNDSADLWEERNLRIEASFSKRDEAFRAADERRTAELKRLNDEKTARRELGRQSE